MNFFKKYSNWIIAFIFVCAVMFVYKTFDNITEILGGIGSALSVVFKALRPFFIAFIIAYVLNMPAKKINAFLSKCNNKYIKYIKKHSYGISVALSAIIVFVFVIVLIAAILPVLYKNIMEIYESLPRYISVIEGYINDSELFKRLEILEEGKVDIFSKLYQNASSIDITQVTKYAQSVLNVTTSVFEIFIAVIASIYMLLDKRRLNDLCKRLLALVFKPKPAGLIVRHASRINDIFINYIYSRLICGIITGAVCGIVLSVLGVKYALLLAIIIAIMDLIPYFGSIISCILSILVALITGGFWLALWTAVALVIIQQIDGNILGPKIMGDSLEIRPLWVVLAVAVGGRIFGFWGMLISVPVIAAIKAIATDYMNSTENSSPIRDKMKETFGGGNRDNGEDSEDSQTNSESNPQTSGGNESEEDNE